jgi:thiazole synthase|uniref:Thiazole synthase n=1 Tax=Thorea hispida TaxID=202687 RepID=A0A1C9CAJ7_9FLOR|nr:thiamin biosynthesis protein G [Thorea hispida]AOM65395.1 thiamin biosynthesis protein G [Thorea hispida]ARX95765.1 thiamin biosynthesis protein G [Thorea hispida]
MSFYIIFIVFLYCILDMLRQKQTRNKTSQLIIANKIFHSRLMIGTGKYTSLKIAKESIEISKANIVTVAIRRANSIKLQGKSNIIDGLNWQSLWLLPNTAGCCNVEEAIRIAALGREMSKKLGQLDNNFIKLEVIPDYNNLLPDPIGTLKAAEFLVQKNFTVLPYINADPVLAKQLEEIGCATVMPLGSPIGSGQGLNNLENLKIILANSTIPVIIDAGIGTASDAVRAMELGADAVLINSAIAKAYKPQLMALAMKYGIISGYHAFCSGRMQQNNIAQASSPLFGLPY